MIEKIYDEVIRNLRKYVNSIDRKNIDSVKVVEKFLENLINRIEYVTNIDNKRNVLEERLLRELRKFSKVLFIRTSNIKIYEEKLHIRKKIYGCSARNFLC